MAWGTSTLQHCIRPSLGCACACCPSCLSPVPALTTTPDEMDGPIRCGCRPVSWSFGSSLLFPTPVWLLSSADWMRRLNPSETSPLLWAVVLPDLAAYPAPWVLLFVRMAKGRNQSLEHCAENLLASGCWLVGPTTLHRLRPAGVCLVSCILTMFHPHN